MLKHEILKRCGLEAPRGSAGRGEIGRVVAWSLAAIVSLAAVTVYGIPFVAERLTPLIPLSFENRFGDMAENQVKLVFGDKVCTTRAGAAAFANSSTR